jgi:hypothetical protein
LETALQAWWCWQVRKLAWRITLLDGQKHVKKYVHVWLVEWQQVNGSSR